MSLQELDYRFSSRKKEASTKPTAIVGEPTIKRLEAGETVELDAVTLVPAFEMKR